VAHGGLAAAEEEAFEDWKDFLPRERLDAVAADAVVLEHAHVVLERVVRRIERVAELVALKEVVVPARLAARAVLGVDGAADGPERPRLALDPDHDALLASGIVDPAEHALCAAPLGSLTTHPMRIQSPAMAFRNLFSFLFQRSSAEERVAAYVIREHDRGRDLAEILEDRYVQNRLSPDQRARLLDRPEVIKAIGNDTIEDAREALES
jgi:hypothetical protein